MEDPTILLADDNENDVYLMKRAFHRLGLLDSLRIVRDGQEAIEYLSGAGKFSDRGKYPAPSLLILDLAMPRKTGEEVLDWLKTRPDLKDLLVVIMTSAMRRFSSGESFERHGNVFVFNSELLKPATVETVETLVGLFRIWLSNVCGREVEELSHRSDGTQAE